MWYICDHAADISMNGLDALQLSSNGSLDIDCLGFLYALDRGFEQVIEAGLLVFQRQNSAWGAVACPYLSLDILSGSVADVIVHEHPQEGLLNDSAFELSLWG